MDAESVGETKSACGNEAAPTHGERFGCRDEIFLLNEKSVRGKKFG